MTEARVIPDVEQTIVDTVNHCRAQFDYVFTTGGIGPTHDDITADSIALAFGIEVEEHPEVAALIRKREAPPQVMAARLRMARIPVGATLIDNPTGGPPGFQYPAAMWKMDGPKGPEIIFSYFFLANKLFKNVFVKFSQYIN